MSKKILIAIVITIIALIFTCGMLVFYTDNAELKTIHSEAELKGIYNYNKNNNSETNGKFSYIIGGPFYVMMQILSSNRGILNSKDIDYSRPKYSLDSIGSKSSNSTSINPGSFSGPTSTASDSGTSTNTSTSKDYSTTNIQVENVDEADITKTDGDYIYSISEDNVIITNAQKPEDIKIEATIKSGDGSIPEDLILYNNKLIIIASKNAFSSTTRTSYGYNSDNNTIVKVYDVSNKSKTDMVKSFELYEPYYTSRCINNQLYIISSGRLRVDGDNIERTYKENREEQELHYNKIKYLKDVKTDMQTLIATQDLNNIDDEIGLTSYLVDISNAYVSENGIYLLDERYNDDYYNDESKVSSLFGLKGIFGLFDYDKNYDYTKHTEIYKFNISNNGSIDYSNKTKIKGQTINQYSLDEKNGHLRIALYDSNGARVVIFNEKLEQIGISSNLAKGEKMYSSRFIGDKAYLVTYKTIDPLFVIDLSNEANPKVLGELKIPGYSTYLHPYDENHLIGIGMQTEETINKNSNGKVTSTTAKITGMKMALFDISDVKNPKQISETVIGDSRTTSAILTNPKALLFSKEKQLIAIPVNNYDEDFEVSSSDGTYSSVIDSYKKYNKPRVSEGYFVYRINTEEGFKLKGVITHETAQKNNYKNYYYSATKLLRGMYIDNNLYTVSENAIKVNNLETLELLKELKLK